MGKLSRWYPPEIKPVWIGEYDTQTELHGFKVRSSWDGFHWYFTGEFMGGGPLLNQAVYWRGLASKPRGKK